jgi:Zn-finger nucleic acid-binding protein
MKCLECQNDLVKVPTAQGPDLDVCPSSHGLWLDAGEVNCFVEDYGSLKRARTSSGDVAISTQTLCPRCNTHVESETLSGTSFLSCRLCHGWWLSHGCLTRLNEAYKGTAVAIQVHEQELYLRAAAKAKTPRHSARDLSPLKRTARQNMLFWGLFLGLALVIAGIIFVAGLLKTVHTISWSHPPDAPLLYLLGGAGGGIGLFGYGWMIGQRKRLIENIPTSSIRSLALGLVEISGHAQPKENLLTSPFGGLPCVFYSYAVEERVGSGKNARWKKIADGTSERPFFVADATGRVLVVSLDADLHLSDEQIFRTNRRGELPPLTMAGLRRLGIAPEGWMGAKTLRCREALILPGARVYVLGTAQELHGMGAQIDNPSRLYIGSGRDHAFIISDRNENDLLSRLEWQFWTSVIGGLALAATCVTIVVHRYVTIIAP